MITKAKSEKPVLKRVGILKTKNMAHRSATITIINFTELELKRTKEYLSHGIWTTNELPPETISSLSDISFESESNGFLTGTQGSATYSCPEGDFVFNWDVPWDGSNEFSRTFPDSYKVKQTASGNLNAGIIWVISNK